MDLHTVLAFTVVAVVVELVPGPNFVLLVRTVPNAGLAAGFGNIGGFAAAFLTHGTLSVLGLSALVAASPLILDAVKLAGGAYLIVLGGRALLESSMSARRRGGRRWPPVDIDVGKLESERRLSRAIGAGYVTNLLNPKIGLFYLAAFPAFIGASSPPGEALVLVSIHVAVAVGWFSAVALLCARVVGPFSGGVASNVVTALSGVVLLGLGISVLTS